MKKNDFPCRVGFSFLAAIFAVSACLIADDSEISIRAWLGRQKEESVLKIEAVKNQYGSYAVYHVKRIKIINSNGTLKQVIDRNSIQADDFGDSIGEYYEQDAEALKKQGARSLQDDSGQDFLILEDLNSDGCVDMIIRCGCGTGGCVFNILLFHPDRNGFVFSKSFSEKAETIRDMRVDKKNSLLEVYEGYQMDHSLTKFKVEGFETLRIVYSKYRHESGEGTYYTETTYTADGRTVEKKWFEKSRD